MKKFFVVACLAAMVLASQSTVWAGGGAKGDPKITVWNNTTAGLRLFVITNAPQALIDTINAGGPYAPTLLTEFTNAGGQILNPGQPHTFKEKVGTVKVSAVYEKSAGVFGTPVTAKSVPLAKGQLVQLGVVSGAAPTYIATFTP